MLVAILNFLRAWRRYNTSLRELYQLGERGGLVGRGRAQRTHLVEHDRHAARGDLPSRFGSGKPAADDVHCWQTVFGHGTRLYLVPFSVLQMAAGGTRNQPGLKRQRGF